MRKGRGKQAPRRRVATYCRKSTSRGLDQQLNSLDAQREAVEAFIKSQPGWMALPDRYDDGGFSGATTDRPAFRRLMEDVRSGRIDVVAIYKLDRLSRSLLDFTATVREFEELGVTLVSVTQRFDTSDSMGRMVMNMLATFAQFERDLISERTRDKIAATRRRGLWAGGHPPLGYDCVDKKLVIAEEEAARVREIFQLYLRLGSLGELVNELRRRGWRYKDRVTRAGRQIRGATFDKSKVRKLMTNPVYRGLVPYRDETFPGAHDAIIEDDVWDAVQTQLRRNRRCGGARVRNKWNMLLTGLLRCARCGGVMKHTYSSKGSTKYHYYRCQSHDLPGNGKCPGARAPAKELEEFIVDRIRTIGEDSSVISDVLAAAEAEIARKRPELVAESRAIRADTTRLADERKNLLAVLGLSGNSAASTVGQRIGELDDEIRRLEDRGAAIRDQLIAIESNAVDEADLRAALAEFDQMWEHLIPREKSRVLALLVEEISFDGESEEVHVTYHPNGVRALSAGGDR